MIVSDEPLYGDMPIQALSKFLDTLPKEHSVTEFWRDFGGFLSQYYGGKHGEEKPNQTTIDAMLKAYSDEGHSGYSNLVVTQLIMEYLSGQMSDEDKAKLKELRKI